MPFVQESAVGNEIRYARSDHTISIPRPDVDRQLGVVNACTRCHADWSSERIAQETRRLWGELKPLRPITAALLQRGSREELQRTLLAADTTHRFAYAGVLARHFASLDGIDAERLPRRVRTHLWRLTTSQDDDIAALALATLHLDAGADAPTRAALIERLRTLGARDLNVRRRWAIALGHRADAYREQLRTTEATALYTRALELLPGDAAFTLALGRARLDAGDAPRASELLRQLTSTEPDNSLAWINYGHARTAAGDAPAAFEAYRQATIANPYDGLAHFHFGNALLAAGRRDDAIPAWRRAVELDPSLAAAHFNLARAFLLQGQNEAALSPLRAGLVFDPSNQEARDVVTQLERGARPQR